MVLLNVVDDRDRDQIAHTHLTPQEQSDLGATDIILYELLDDMDVVFPHLQTREGFVDIRATALHNEGLEEALANQL